MQRTLTLLLTFFSAPGASLQAAENKRPNVVYIMADDLGWGDISAHGGGVPTPNIDRLFSKGVELTQFMGWCVCSPTRAMLLTGRHPIRLGTAPETGGELDPAETTIAEGFKANGYRTGVFGKWHNGNDPGTPEFSAHFTEAFKHMPNKNGGCGHGVCSSAPDNNVATVEAELTEPGLIEKWNGLCGDLDMFPMLMVLTDSQMPETRPLDGRNIGPALRGNTRSPVESCFRVWRDCDDVAWVPFRQRWHSPHCRRPR